MVEAFLAGLLAGYGIAVPVGAIAILIIHTAIDDGFRRGFAAGAGAATADLVYAALAVVFGVAAAGLVAPLLMPLRVVAGVVLIGLAVVGLARLRSARETGDPAGTLAAHRSGPRTYLTFVALTLLNPVTVVYFGALVVALPFLGARSSGLPSSVAYSWLPCRGRPSWPASAPRSVGIRATDCACHRSSWATW